MNTLNISALAALLILSTSHALPVIQTEQPAGVILTSGSGSVTFPNVNVGATYSKTITLRNIGDLDLLVSQATLSGIAASEYSILVQSENTIIPGKSSFIRLAFSPTSTGSRSATLTIPSNTSGQPSFTLSLSGTATQMSGSRRFVRSTATGANNGTSWNNAFTSLNAAITASVAGDEIWVASGTYKPTSGTDRNVSFQLKNGLSIYGGFAGTESAVSERNIPANPTILSGDLLNNDNSNIVHSEATRSDNSVHVVTTGPTATTGASITLPTFLNGFIVQGGNADGSSSHYGGGIFLEFTNRDSSNVTVENCVIRENTTVFDGAGIMNTGHARILSCVFERNRSSGSGSAILNYERTAPQILNCVFKGNLGGSTIYSGDIYSRPEIINCTFSGNEGVVYNAAYSSPQIRNCIFWGNIPKPAVTFDVAALNTSSPGLVESCFVEGGYAGSSNQSINPLFVNQNAPSGVDGIWGTQDDGLRLRNNSPAMDEGSSRACLGFIDFDIRHMQRIVGAVDVGAYENISDIDHDGLPDIYETGTEIYVSATSTGSKPNVADSDGDGILDGVEVNIHGTNPNLTDSDADGFDDLFEINTGFSPISATSTPDALSTIRTAVEFRFNAANGVNYRIEGSTDLQNWDTIETGIIGAGGVVTRFYSTENQPKRYFRVKRN